MQSSLSKMSDASQLNEGEYEWDLRHRVIPVGETPQRRFRLPPRDMVLLKTCRVRGDLSWTIGWLPVPFFSTFIQSDEISTQFFNINLSHIGIPPTASHSRDRMINDIISLARSITNVNGHDLRSYVSGMEFPLIEARIWDAEAKEEAVSVLSRMTVDELPQCWFVSCPLVIDRLNRLEKVMFSESDECSICLRKYVVGQEVVRMPCLHSFHFHCILSWLESSNSCPLCRRPTT